MPLDIPANTEIPALPPGESPLSKDKKPANQNLSDEEKRFEEEEDRQLFGDGPADKKEDGAFGADELGSHTLKFEFISRVTFMKKEIGLNGKVASSAPYMEVEYANHCETALNIAKGRQDKEVACEIVASHSGSLANNEYFDCRLEIDMARQQSPVQIVTSMKTEKLNEDEEKRTLAIKFLFDQGMCEDWYSYCTDVTGATLNTQGAAECYNVEVLSQIDPSLKAIVIEDYDSTKDSTVDLNASPSQMEDLEVNNVLTFSGEGKITIEVN